MCINLLYKIGFRINTNYLYFIMIILQDLSIIGFIFSKMNDLANSKDLFDDLDLSNEKINKWYDDGFITFGFEVSYCILSLIFCVIKTIKFIWDKCKKK